MSLPPPNQVRDLVDFVTKVPDVVRQGAQAHRDGRAGFWVMVVGVGFAIVAGMLVPDDNAVIMVPMVLATLVIAIWVSVKRD